MQELEYLKKVVHVSVPARHIIICTYLFRNIQVQSLEVELLNARFAQLAEFVKEVRTYAIINVILI